MEIPRQLEIEARLYGLGRDALRGRDVRNRLIAGHRPPVAEHQAPEPEAATADIGLQDIREQVLVLRVLGAVDAVVRRHDATGAAVPYGHFEVATVDFSQRLLIHLRVLVGTTILDVVGSEVLGTRDDVLLNTGNQG